jgi:hypothetical protein
MRELALLCSDWLRGGRRFHQARVRCTRKTKTIEKTTLKWTLPVSFALLMFCGRMPEGHEGWFADIFHGITWRLMLPRRQPIGVDMRFPIA